MSRVKRSLEMAEAGAAPFKAILAPDQRVSIGQGPAPEFLRFRCGELAAES
jgi:hypothetical protein